MRHTIDDYADMAKTHAGLKSDRDLSKRLGQNAQLVTMWRTRRAWPSDSVMVRLAELAGIPEEEALLELAIWRTSDDARPIYEHLLTMLKQSAAAILLAFGIAATGSALHPAQANTTSWTDGEQINGLDSRTKHYAT